MRERVVADRLRDLESVTDAALAHLPLEQLLSELLTRVVEIVEADTAAILLLDDEGRTLVARAAKGLEEEVERGVRVPVRAGFAGRIAATRQPVVIENVEQADIHNPLLREKGLKSLLGVPLMVEGSVIGVLHVGSLRRRLFTDREVDVLQRAGDRAALAINPAHRAGARAGRRSAAQLDPEAARPAGRSARGSLPPGRLGAPRR